MNNRSRQSQSPALRVDVKRGVSPGPPIAHDRNHWSHRVQESVVSGGTDGINDLVINGGAENGQFCWLGSTHDVQLQYHSGQLIEGDILVEAQGQKLAGYTLHDSLAWITQVSKNGAPVMMKTLKPGKTISVFMVTPMVTPSFRL